MSVVENYAAKLLSLAPPPPPPSLSAADYERLEREGIRESGIIPIAPPSVDPWNIIPHDSLIAPPKPVDWVCEGLKISYGNPTLFAGDPTSRKTLVAQHLAVCVATGKRVFGEYEVKGGPVGHLDYEMGPRLVTERFQRLTRGVGVDLPELPRGALSVGSIPAMFLDGKAVEDQLTAFLEGKRLVVVDSLRNSFGGIDENDSGKIVPLMAMLQRASERTRCAVVLIHHTRKKSGGGDKSGETAWDDPSMIRGSGGIVGASQGVFMFNGGDAQTPTKVSTIPRS